MSDTMEGVQGAQDEQTKSGENAVLSAKAAATTPSAAPKRSRIIDEDDDEEFVPTSVASAPKPVIVAPKKVETKDKAITAVKKEVGGSGDASATETPSKKVNVKSEVKTEANESEKTSPNGSKNVSVKKSAAGASTPSVKKASGTPKQSASKSVKKEPSDSDSDEDYGTPSAKRKVALNGDRIDVKETPSKKAAASTPKKSGTPKKSAVKSEEVETPSKKLRTPKAAGSASKSKAGAKSLADGAEASGSQTPGSQPPASAVTKAEKFKWWEEEASKAMKKHPDWKWASLQHGGVIFPPAYEPHGVKMLYDGKPIDLSPEAEEAASFFAKQVDGPHYEKPQFRKNFFADFREVVRKTSPQTPKLASFSLCDFTPITKYLKEQSELRKARSKEEKEAEKVKKAELKAKYGYAMVNGHKEPLGNFVVEPPGLFLGRGDHPKAGMIKKRIMPEDVTLNLSRDAEVPDCPIPGHKWGGVVHNHAAGWIAGWFEDIAGHHKYIQFAAGSSIKGANDRKKYEKARVLKKHIVAIRSDYMANLKSTDMLVRQRATVMWMLDRLALRIGNEKKEDEADTVGCCSLRVEHVKLIAPSSLEFDFLGKDSMRYNKVVAVPPEIYANMKAFKMGKRDSEDLFDQLSPDKINKHLSALMPSLTAKVFRTYNASITLQEQLAKFAEEFDGAPGEVDVSDNHVRLFYNRANRQVAILCNHQKTVSKMHQQQLNKIDAQIDDLTDLRDILKKHLKDLKAGKASGTNPKKRKRATAEGEEGEEEEIKLPTTPESTQKKIAAVDAKIEKLEADKIDKGEGAQIQNSTSKINYMDPRITVAFCKKAGLPLNKVFPATLLDKFAWAIAEIEDDPDFIF